MRYVGTTKVSRMVIPKEFRDGMKIRKGNSLEVFLTNSGVLIKKPSTIKNCPEMTPNS